MRTNRVLIAGSAAALALASGGCSWFGGQSAADGSQDDNFRADGSEMGISTMKAAGPEASADAFRPALMNGRLEWTESASLDQSYEAALGAIDALDFDMRKRGVNEMEARVLGERADGDAVIIRMFAEDGQTRIALRVGAQGDEAASHQMFDEIQSRLSSASVAQFTDEAESFDSASLDDGDGSSSSEFASSDDSDS